MASLSQARTLGEVGAILVLLGLTLGEVGTILVQLNLTSIIGVFIAIAGLILILTAVKYISELLEDRSVYSYAQIAVALFIVGIVAAQAVLIIEISLSYNYPATTLTTSVFSSTFLGFLVSARTILGVFVLVGAIFLRTSYEVIGTRLSLELFKKTGPLFLIGIGLTITLGPGLGLLILAAAAIMQVAAFFSLPVQISLNSPNRTPKQ